MRKISADYIFPVSSPPIKNGVVVVDDEGVIASPLPVRQAGPAPLLGERGDVERHDGIIIPGFVNAHCHLELSHLKGKISEQKGLTGFFSELLPQKDKFSPELIRSAIESAEGEMLRNGIVAVGDISNTDHSFEQKKKKRLAYHTFIETFDLIAEKAEEKFKEAQTLKLKLKNLNSSIVPHAPYTVTGKLMELIDNLKQPILSIHNQEAASERELFASGTGPLAELMQKAGIDLDQKRRAKSSLLFTFGELMESRKKLTNYQTLIRLKGILLV